VRQLQLSVTGQTRAKVVRDALDGWKHPRRLVSTSRETRGGVKMTAKEIKIKILSASKMTSITCLKNMGSAVDIEHPQFKSICDLRNKVAEFIEQENFEGVIK
jgi:hypothetical protein